MAGPPKQAQRFSRLSLLTVLLTLGAIFPAAAEPRKAPISKEPIVVSLEADAQKLDPPAPTDGPSFLVVEHLYARLVEGEDGAHNLIWSRSKGD